MKNWWSNLSNYWFISQDMENKKEYYKDPVTLKRIETLHPKLKDEAVKIYDEICQAINGNVVVRFSHTLRTFKEQQNLYDQGRTKPGKIVTNAKAGYSYHNYGLAIDIVLIIDKDKNGTFETASWSTSADFDSDGIADWVEVVTIFKKYGWTWGGDWRFKDDPHFQKTFGNSINDLIGKKKDKNNYPII